MVELDSNTMRNLSKNYYEILDVAIDADKLKIKSAFKHQAKKFHPDISGDTGDDFRLLKLAFETLSDPQKRRNYDSTIGVKRSMNRAYTDGRISVSEVSKDVFDDILDVLSDKFKYSRKRSLDFKLYLTNYEFEHGTNTSITIPREKICRTCFGFGGTILQKCNTCGGSGLISYDVEFDLCLDPPLEPGQVYKINRGDYLLRFELKRGNGNV